jgi:hypothetical protein
MFSLTSTASQHCSQAVQAGSKFVNGEELLNLAPAHVIPDPLLMPFSNELDIFMNQNI